MKNTQSADFLGYTCAKMRAHYRFPANFDGTGQTIGIAEWSSGYSQSDLDLFSQREGLPRCVPQYITIDGGQNKPDAECTLDIEIAHGMAPGATIRVYEAPAGADYATFWAQVIALLRYVLAEKDRPSVLSISYGDAESDWSKADVQTVADLIAQLTAAGTTVFVASGDQGAMGMHNVYADPTHTPNADAPATSPAAVSVGGTTLPLGGSAEAAWKESGMGATGGGFSRYHTRPGYQDAVSTNAMRGVPDFSMLADPVTGWQIVFNGQVMPIGGTSAACPAAAALFACIKQARASVGLPDVGDLLPTLYAHLEAFVPVTQGDNSFMGVQGYAAAAPWSACCGLGVPNGEALLAVFAPGAATTTTIAPTAPTTPTTIPVYINGVKQTFSALLRDGMAYVPALLTAKALGVPATRNLSGVYIGKAASLWQRIFGGRA